MGFLFSIAVRAQPMKPTSESSPGEPGSSCGPAAIPHQWQVVAAFAAIYVIWGSTYLAIRFGVESIPPFFMAGTRFLAAGLLLYAVARMRGGARPTRRQWRDASIAGGLMLTAGNGGVTWAEQVIPSGVAALLVALVPLWMVLVDWIRPGGTRPPGRVIAGLAVGFAGVALLARSHPHNAGSVYGWGVVALMAASICWAIGSVYHRHADKPGAPLVGIGMQMISGGVLLLLFSLAQGEAAVLSWENISLHSIGAWFYLTIAGSLIGFPAYVWLLQVSTPARVSTYAYVNPLIAVLLGCTIGRETVSHELFLAGALIVAAVALIVRGAKTRTSSKQPALPIATKPVSTA